MVFERAIIWSFRRTTYFNATILLYSKAYLKMWWYDVYNVLTGLLSQESSHVSSGHYSIIITFCEIYLHLESLKGIDFPILILHSHRASQRSHLRGVISLKLFSIITFRLPSKQMLIQCLQELTLNWANVYTSHAEDLRWSTTEWGIPPGGGVTLETYDLASVFVSMVSMEVLRYWFYSRNAFKQIIPKAVLHLFTIHWLTGLVRDSDLQLW